MNRSTTALTVTASSMLACMGGGGEVPQVCTDYLDCIATESPAQLGALELTYGADGTCWKENDEAQTRCATACTTGLEACEEGDADTDSDSDADTDTDTDADADANVVVTWDDYGVGVRISGFPTTGFDFGMAQTGLEGDGWYGEDCFVGTGPFHMCHHFDGKVGELRSVYDEVIETGNVNLVVESETTLGDAAIQGQLTYIVTADNGDCYVLGHEPGYYADLGCTRL